MKICVIGTGYVGLVAGAGFSDMGNEVVCVDIDADKIATLRRGEMPIFEPGLDKLCAHNVAEGRLSFTTDLAAGVAGAEVIFLAVGTPPGADGSADLSFIFKAAEAAAAALAGATEARDPALAPTIKFDPSAIALALVTIIVPLATTSPPA